MCHLAISALKVGLHFSHGGLAGPFDHLQSVRHRVVRSWMRLKSQGIYIERVLYSGSTKLRLHRLIWGLETTRDPLFFLICRKRMEQGGKEKDVFVFETGAAAGGASRAIRVAEAPQ